MLDLYNNKYDRATLKKYIYAVSLKDILKTQHLDTSFVVRYILNNNYQLTQEDNTIDIDMVLQYQDHLTKEQIINEQGLYDVKYDSVDEFDKYN
jgi:hypothetical protein